MCEKLTEMAFLFSFFSLLSVLLVSVPAALGGGEPLMTGVRADNISGEGGGTTGRQTDRYYPSWTEWNNRGHWLEWEIDIPQEGFYVPSFIYVRKGGPALRKLGIDGEVKIENLEFPDTGGWGWDPEDWRFKTVDHELHLSEGTHTLRMENISGEALDMAWIYFAPPDPTDVLTEVVDSLSAPDGFSPAGLKQAVSILAGLSDDGKDDEIVFPLLPEVLPVLKHAAQDESSAGLRSQALSILTELDPQAEHSGSLLLDIVKNREEKDALRLEALKAINEARQLHGKVADDRDAVDELLHIALNADDWTMVVEASQLLDSAAADVPGRVSSVLSGEPVEIGSRRELFLDDLLVRWKGGGARRVFHNPVPREIVMTFDDPSAGNTWGYPTVFKDGDLYRMYYRSARREVREDGTWGSTLPEHIAYAESRDGVNWTRPELGLFELDGSKDNNVVWRGTGSHAWVPFKDENPEASPEAAYKAVGFRRGPGPWTEATKELVVFQSPDAINWEQVQDEGILDDGNFDSQNVVFWDPNIGAYRAYYRISGRSIPAPGIEFPDHSGRNIKTATSPDFAENWPKEGEPLEHIKRPPAQFYTNVIRPYYRAPHIYIGMPGMYDDRGWSYAMEQLPNLEERRSWYEAIGRLERGPLGGESLLMWSRDGVRFERSPSAFLRPGPERPGSWWYGDSWIAWHVVETDSVFEGAAPELSFYAKEKTGPQNLADRVRRYTLRLDGFASIHAPIEGGELVTAPLVFEGSELSMNFATSAFGSLKVELQDAEGNPIPGFTLDDSIELYGDTVARSAMWEDDPDLGALAGKPVRLRFVMRDSDLYSIKFE